jgi:protein O-mannosyl-transferase
MTSGDPNANPLSDDKRGAGSCFRFPAFRLPLLFVLVFAAYWPALHGQFIWDDQLLVIKNPLVTGELNLRSVWFETDFSFTTFALWLQWKLLGSNPMGYHAVNIALHTLNCVLLWKVLKRLGVPGAWLAAALFAVHPVAAASVAWISEMKNTLSLFFCLLSFLWFLTAEEKPLPTERKQAGSWLGLSLLMFLLALLSKTSTVVLPVVLLGCAWWRRGKVTRLDVARTIPFFVVAFALGYATIWFQARVMADGDPVQTESFFGRFAAAGKAVWFYLGKVILPLNLSMIYPRWTINSASALAYVPALLWLAVLGFCWKFRGRSWGRAGLFALSCFTVALFPVMGFLSMDYLVISRVSDHFQYLPMIAMLALIAAALHKLLTFRLQVGMAIVTLLALSALTFQRSQIMAHDETLWHHTLAKNPGSFTAHNNLGCILAAQNKLDEAIPEFEATLRLNPKNAPAHCNLGRALAMQRKFTEAEIHFQAALKIKPTDAEIHQSYGSALAQQGRIAEAITHLQKSIKAAPNVVVRRQLAGLFHAMGRFSESVAQYHETLKREPDSIETLNNLAWMLATSPDAQVRNANDAIQFAERACRLTDYSKAPLVGTLAAAYAEAGRFEDAASYASKAAELAAAAGDQRFATLNRQLLSLYQARQPFREPAR